MRRFPSLNCFLSFRQVRRIFFFQTFREMIPSSRESSVRDNVILKSPNRQTATAGFEEMVEATRIRGLSRSPILSTPFEMRVP